MGCTTILVGKKASYDGSTMIARNDDGNFDVKKLVVVNPDQTKTKYKSVISHLEIDLPKNPLRYTATPKVDKVRGIWAANGINEANVGMTATETLSTNPLVLGADPYVVYQERKGNKKEVPGGLGEEDLVVLVLPYIKTAREGVLRLGSLLEKYGTYEPNGIAFYDENEAWWLETIGGHHWIAKRVKDDEYVIMPNQFGIDSFDLSDAYGEQKEHLCSKDLKKFISDNFLNLNKGKVFNPRYIFGSHSDGDHVYNTPRAWFMGRYFNPKTYKWDGPDADFNPESDDIPWSMVPEKKITVEDIKYILSSYYQGTPDNPMSKVEDPKKGVYR
ncbi:MAG: C69 family dipeptidase, partial [Erysipelotrichaceae bacterium]|nr:C69 family dipeptidase [Erysipelotrichaceae bacterium]